MFLFVQFSLCSFVPSFLFCFVSFVCCVMFHVSVLFRFVCSVLFRFMRLFCYVSVRLSVLFRFNSCVLFVSSGFVSLRVLRFVVFQAFYSRGLLCLMAFFRLAPVFMFRFGCFCSVRFVSFYCVCFVFITCLFVFFRVFHFISAAFSAWVIYYSRVSDRSFHLLGWSVKNCVLRLLLIIVVFFCFCLCSNPIYAGATVVPVFPYFFHQC